MANWVQLSSEVVHEGAFLTLHRDRVVKPDGAGTGFYEHVSVDDVVRVVVLDDHGRVAIVEDDFYLQRRRVRHLPGGGSAGEEPQQAARRRENRWHYVWVLSRKAQRLN
ncbi:hypothetical protein ACFXI6_51380 [Streptomyces mirabilis]|uniref:hypothetical protein n=1 Tax=Streptomyces mirabilis TaxID=68239 RepID=UPI0036859B90